MFPLAFHDRMHSEECTGCVFQVLGYGEDVAHKIDAHYPKHLEFVRPLILS